MSKGDEENDDDDDGEEVEENAEICRPYRRLLLLLTTKAVVFGDVAFRFNPTLCFLLFNNERAAEDVKEGEVDVNGDCMSTMIIRTCSSVSVDATRGRVYEARLWIWFRPFGYSFFICDFFLLSWSKFCLSLRLSYLLHFVLKVLSLSLLLYYVNVSCLDHHLDRLCLPYLLDRHHLERLRFSGCAQSRRWKELNTWLRTPQL